LFSIFNAPLFATFIIGMFWKRMTPAAGWIGLSAGTLAAVATGIATEGTLGGLSQGWVHLSGQGAAFVAASVAFVVDVVLSVIVSMVTEPKPVSELKGLVYSETPKEDLVDADEETYPWYRRTIPLAGIALVLVIVLNALF
jgi:SSS family solute:Na+ symporter